MADYRPAAKLAVAGVPVGVSHHAVGRYRERVRNLSKRDAAADLERVLLAAGRWTTSPPEWVGQFPGDGVDRADRWLLIGDDIVLPVIGELAVSCLARGSITPYERHRRRERRKSRRASRRKRRGSDPRPIPGWTE